MAVALDSPHDLLVKIVEQSLHIRLVATVGPKAIAVETRRAQHFEVGVIADKLVQPVYQCGWV